MMDPRSHPYFHHQHHHQHHHNSRYAPPPPNPIPIPNPLSYSQNPNFYTPSSHPNPPPAHLLPPPPQQPHPPSLTLPRLFQRSDDSQFLHNPNPISNYPVHRDEYRPNYRDEYPRRLHDFDRERNKRPDFGDHHGRDWVPGSSRIVDDEERLARRWSPRDFRVVQANGYEGRRVFPGDDIDENRLRDKVMLRDLRDSCVGSGSNEGDDGVRVFSKKLDFYRNRDSDLEFQRHGGRGIIVGSREYNRTPSKQLQKKSAFLRIQKPSYKSREDHRVHFSGPFNDARSSSFRGIDQNLKSDGGAEVGSEREGSPVELDVSFKSNSLVAKAIVTPSSPSVSISDAGLMLRNSKIRKVLIPDEDSFKMFPSKLSDSTVRLENSVPASKGAFNSDKGIKQSCKDANASACDGIAKLEDSVTAPTSACISDKGMKQSSACDVTIKLDSLTAPKSASNSDEGVKQSLKDAKASAWDGDGSSLASSGTTSVVGKDKAEHSIKCSSLAGYGATRVSSRKDKVEKSVKSSVPSDGVNNVVLGNDSSPKVVKRKKVVKRVVKKVVNRKSSSSNLEPVRECDASVERGSSSHHPLASSRSDNAVAMSSSDILDSHHCANEATILRSCKVEESTKVPVMGQARSGVDFEQSGSGVDSGCFSVPNTKRKRNRSTSPLAVSRIDETKIDKCLVNGNSVKDLAAVSHTLEDIIKCQNEISSSDCDLVVGNQFCQDSGSDIRGGSPKASHFLQGNTGLGLLILGNTGICQVPATLHSTTLGVDSGLTTNQQKEKTVTGLEISAVDFMNQGNQSVENSGEDQFGNDRFSVESRQIFEISISREPVTQNVAIAADNYNHGVDRIIGSEEDFTNTERNDISSDGIGKEMSIRSSAESVPFRQSSSAIFSVDASKEDTCLVKSNNKYTKASHLDLSRSEVKDVSSHVVNMGNTTRWVDTTLRLSFKDWDGLPQSSSTDLSDAKFSIGSNLDLLPNETLLKDKNMKFSPSELELCSPLESGNEGPITAGTSMLGVEVSHICDGQAKGDGVTVYGMDLLSTHFAPLPDQVFALPESSAEGNLNTTGSLRDTFGGDGLKGVRTCQTAEGLSTPKPQMPCQLEVTSMQITDATPVLEGGSHQSGSMDFDSGKGGKMDMGVDDAEEKLVIDAMNTDSQGSLGLQLPDSERSPSKAEENEGYDSERHDFFGSNCCWTNVDGDGTPAANSCDEHAEFVPDTGFDGGSPENLPIVPGEPLSQAFVENICQDDKIVGQKPAPQASGIPQVSYSLNPKPSHHNVQNHSIKRKAGSLLLQDLQNNTHLQNATSVGGHQRNTHPTQNVSSTYTGSSSLAFSVSRKAAMSSYIAKPRTWCRTDNSLSACSGNNSLPSIVSMQRQLPKTGTAKFLNTSYIRKGNSLVRKASPVTTQSLVSHGLSHGRQPGSLVTDETKIAGIEHAIVAVDSPNFVRTGGLNASLERLRTPPLPIGPKVPNHIPISMGNCISSVVAEPVLSMETASVPSEVTDWKHLPRSPEDVSRLSETSVIQADPVNSLECQSEQHGENLVLSNVKRITYVKRKSNQLVASSALTAESHNSAASAAGNYYKRRKYQLIRTSVDGHAKLKSSTNDGSLNLEGQASLNIPSISFKRLLHKVSMKTYKPSKFSLVWTPRGSQPSKPLHNEVLPQLFPWKRATYWRNFSRDLTSRKWMLFRNMDTLYTRSKHGFSLQKLKVLGIHGSSLKWSKSMETRSKKASEEATHAAAERKKREQKGERIFRIGSVRYKMDSSRRTLQRISDDDASSSDSLQAEQDVKKSYVPRRLIIDKHEYVRIGNGNQLVRDPKKRTRILASEKVRWSLHTVRSRLAKKRKYCQFFTRFGKCNKDDGKCPYMHDPSKIAVCTKFLNGLCSNSDCKLTHKVIPERMPDCSYYLQGLCNNGSCPYRHVHVDPSASTCEGFLRGYCADGNECRKKHSYVCPIYEATGSCPQGSKCKLHHPKIRIKGKKIKQSREKNAQMRYFGSMHMNGVESGVAVSGKRPLLNYGDRYGGDTPDFIGIGMSDEEAMENDNLADQQTNLSDSDLMDIQLCDLDELIKPIRIMNI